MEQLVGFLKVTDVERSKTFYMDHLGLTYLKEDAFALVLRSGANMVRLVKESMFKSQHSTVLGWETANLQKRVEQLTAKGVPFLRYPWFEHDQLGIWTAPSGDQVAWFTDPDGNVLSLSQLKQQT